MTNRFNSKPGQFGIPSGYEGSALDSVFEIPSVGIQDIDEGLANTINEIKFQVSKGSALLQQNVQVVFAVGEKWSLAKSNKVLKDANGKLILPIITIHRKTINHDDSSVTGMGMNQNTGEIVVKTRLAKEDRNFQNILSKVGLNFQLNVPGEHSIISTDRNIGENSNDFDVRKGAFLSPKINKNIYEFLVMPQPQFFVAEYEITIWVQYFEHMNEILDKLMSAYLAPAQRTLKIDTAKGYWFVAYFEGSYTIEDNADSNAGEETIRKCSISVKIPGYTFASKSPGVPLSIRRYVSAPVVNFGFGISQSDTEFEVVDRGEIVTQEKPEFNLGERVVARDNLTQVDLENTESLATTGVDITSGKSQIKYKKVSYKNKNKGESIVNLDVFNGPFVVTYKK